MALPREFINTLLDASFRGVFFHCQVTEDSVERALAVHEYPYRDGGEIDDMGRRARPFEMSAIFFGETYQSDLETFVNALNEGGEGELVHPVFGVQPVMVEAFQIKHDAEGPDSCTVQLSFRESGINNPFFGGAKTPAGKAEEAADDATDAMEDATDTFNLNLTEWVRDFMGENPLTSAVQAVSDVFNKAAAILNDVTGAIDLAISFLDFPQALVSQMESVTAKVRRLAGLDMDGVKGRFRGWQRLSNFLKGFSAGGKNKAKTYKTAPIKENASGAATPTETTGPANDEDSLADDAVTTSPEGEAEAIASGVVNVIETKEITQAVCDILEEEAKNPTLSPPEVESMVNNTRERIQDCIDLARVSMPKHRAYVAINHLRNAALAVQELGAAVINARPPLITVTLEAPANHHLLAHRLYGDYSRAPEILRLNPAIRQPNLMRRGQRVKAYAR